MAQDSLAAVPDRPIAVAIVAMGGQGGGVLSDWIAAAAEASGYVVQATSVPGVAQRTGATIYYIEMIRPLPGAATPVLALMPTPGDVDVVLAAELMEAGRSLLRGLVTPDRTTLIASSQRAYATAEKEKPGDGTADGGAVVEAIGVAAKRAIVADFARIAETNGSVISASLLGALAASGALPFPRMAFLDAIKAGGVGVEASIRAFEAAFAHAHGDAAARRPEVPAKPDKRLPVPPASSDVPELDALLRRIHALPGPVQPMVYAGVRHLVDYQDAAYAAEYLDRLAPILVREGPHADKAFELSIETARHLARAMAYDDVIRVADLKTRSARSQRVAREVAVKADVQVLQTTEYFHPRMEEVCATLPKGLGHAIESRPWLSRALGALFEKGRRIRTDSISGFLQLYIVALRKPKRRGTLRHGREMAHIEAWLAKVLDAAKVDYALGVEIAKARRLIKGYSDTMSRGQSKYDRVLKGAAVVAGRADAAAWVRRLRQSALLDEAGEALDGALRTIATLEAPQSDRPLEGARP
jgi:indolepyruvate ferredoxin oxidoreductase beta subunit